MHELDLDQLVTVTGGFDAAQACIAGEIIGVPAGALSGAAAGGLVGFAAAGVGAPFGAAAGGALGSVIGGLTGCAANIGAEALRSWLRRE